MPGLQSAGPKKGDKDASWSVISVNWRSVRPARHYTELAALGLEVSVTVMGTPPSSRPPSAAVRNVHVALEPVLTSSRLRAPSKTAWMAQLRQPT